MSGVPVVPQKGGVFFPRFEGCKVSKVFWTNFLHYNAHFLFSRRNWSSWDFGKVMDEEYRLRFIIISLKIWNLCNDIVHNKREIHWEGIFQQTINFSWFYPAFEWPYPIKSLVSFGLAFPPVWVFKADKRCILECPFKLCKDHVGYIRKLIWGSSFKWIRSVCIFWSIYL